KRRAGIMEALVAGEELLERVKKLKGVRRVEIAGSLRRRRETIADIDFVGAVKDMSEAPAIMSAFVKLDGIVQTIVTGPSKSCAKTAARSTRQSKSACRSSSQERTSAAIFTPTPTNPTAGTPSKKWPPPPKRSGTNTSPSPITPKRWR